MSNTDNNNERESDLQMYQIKQAVLEKFDEAKELYDERDLHSLATKSGSDLVLRYLKINSLRKEPIKEAINDLNEFLKWRKARKINDLKQADFPRELYEWGLLEFIPDEEKATFTILFRMALWQRNSAWNELFIDGVIFTIEQWIAKMGWREDLKVTLAIDMQGISIRETDLGLAFGVAQVMMNYPKLVEAYVIDLPFLARPLAAVVLKFFPERHKEAFKTMERSTFKEDFLAKGGDLERLPENLGGERKMALETPEGCSGWEEVALRRGIGDAALEKLRKQIEKCIVKREAFN